MKRMRRRNRCWKQRLATIEPGWLGPERYLQMVEYGASDALYVPKSDSKVEDDEMHVGSDQELAPGTTKRPSFLDEMEQNRGMFVKVKQICKGFEASVAMGSCDKQPHKKRVAKRLGAKERGGKHYAHVFVF